MTADSVADGGIKLDPPDLSQRRCGAQHAVRKGRQEKASSGIA